MAPLFFIGLVLLGTVVLWRLGSSSQGRASKRLVVAGFGLLIVVTVLMPDVTTRVANAIGIGRGADLVFYLTSIGLMFLAAVTYISQRRTEDRLAELISAQAAARVLEQFREPSGGLDGSDVRDGSAAVDLS